MSTVNANILATTTEKINKGIIDQVLMPNPLFARLLMKKTAPWDGGTSLEYIIQTANTDDLVQTYKPTDQLTAARKTVLTRAKFYWKYANAQISYDVEDELQNRGDSAIENLTDRLADIAMESMRIKLTKVAYGIDTPNETSDSGTDFQSIPEALDHSRAYGGITSDTGDNAYWNGASLAGTYSDRNTAVSCSLSTVRQAISTVRKYAKTPGSLLAITSPTNHLNLKSQLEAMNAYSQQGSKLAKFGFDSFMLDGVEHVPDYYLTGSQTINGSSDTLDTWYFLLNTDHIELRLHPKRNFKITKMVWQGDRANGYDQWLGRILIAGNLICYKPNGSLWLSNMS